ncbi:MAG: peptide chain release factor N(5)-glutamine methyltransferase [Deltaproteobacteria bacterium]|nr:peptide chain release factor N(5)-glutamine methyltransferase [Deltaproteobacteria bacterium]
MKKKGQTLKPEWTILKLIQWTTSYFTSRQVENPRVAAEILLAHTLGIKRVDLYIQFDQPLSENELAGFKGLIKRRAQKEPVAYITGSKEFWSIDFKVTPDVLIPRPDTECLVETALEYLSGKPNSPPKKIFEPGTGSGAIIIALCSEHPEHTFFASDLSLKATETAKTNANKCNLKKTVRFFSGDWLAPLNHITGRFDLIISNPPYIPTDVIKTLQPEICEYEPRLALDGDKDGLSALRHLIMSAHSFLKPGGCLILEIGHDQKNHIKKIITDCGNYADIFFRKDYGGNYRVVQMNKK